MSSEEEKAPLKPPSQPGKPELPDYEDDNPPPDESGNPSADQRADFVVKRLEQFIREGRTIAEGMSLKKWQDMARFEISNALIAAENANTDDEQVSKRLLFTIAASLVTIGFWGTLFAYDKAHYMIVALICGVAGIVMLAVVGEWRFRKAFKRHQARQREKSLRRVEDLTRRIKRMEKELKKEAKSLEEQLAEEMERALKERLMGKR